MIVFRIQINPCSKTKKPRKATVFAFFAFYDVQMVTPN
ncbi:hypothetical protein C943_00130 [Mariniradius saccharolyticus AK6]|uniref:Uncharacterized protein n=1 Tax=Mariniradius saccharolyticus AK6 TaxID=1239962 RepID=M7Y3Q4_9BACT|nr:hypothetical protein C943_00130 [Mariniradius saccharolyticus AK6]